MVQWRQYENMQINLLSAVRFMETVFSGTQHDLLKHLKQ